MRKTEVSRETRDTNGFEEILWKADDTLFGYLTILLLELSISKRLVLSGLSYLLFESRRSSEEYSFKLGL